MEKPPRKNSPSAFLDCDKPILVPLKQAAAKIGVNYRQILEAVNCGEVPTYRLHKERRLVSLNQVIEVMTKGDGNV